MSEVTVKKYVVRLSKDERSALEDLMSKGKHPAATILKARVLLNRLRKYTGNSRISVVCWRLADVWRADLWIFAVLPGENHAAGQTPGMTTPRQSAAWGSAPSCTLPQSR